MHCAWSCALCHSHIVPQLCIDHNSIFSSLCPTQATPKEGAVRAQCASRCKATSPHRTSGTWRGRARQRSAVCVARGCVQTANGTDAGCVRTTCVRAASHTPSTTAGMAHGVRVRVCVCRGGGGRTLSGQCPLQRSASSTTLPQRHTHSPSSSETSVVLNVAVMVSASANPDAFSPAVTLWLARWATRPLSVSPLLRGSGPFCYFVENSMEEGGKTACDLCSKACSTAQPAACFRYSTIATTIGVFVLKCFQNVNILHAEVFYCMCRK
jgi:hypothetical protein